MLILICLLFPAGPIHVQPNGVNRATPVQVLLEYLEMNSVNQHSQGQSKYQLLIVALILGTSTVISETILLHTYSSQLPLYPL